jgi:hypothetical protein
MRKILYDFVATVIIVVSAAIARSYYDFASISEAISTSVPTVIGIYIAGFTLIKSIAEKKFKDAYMASVDVIVTTEKNDWNKLPRTLTLENEKYKNCYILIKVNGSLKALEKSEIVIVFPTSITVSRDDYQNLGNQLENETKIELKNIAATSGSSTVILNASMAKKPMEEEKITKCRLIKNKKLALVEFSSSEMGIETKL